MSTTPIVPEVKPAAIAATPSNFFVHLIYGHLFWVALLVVLGVAGHEWLKEHDARIESDKAIKSAETQVKGLQDQIAVLRTVTAQKVVVIQKEAAAIKTPVQAAPIVEAFDPRLNPRLIPTAPLDLQVAAVPLAQALEQCKIDRVQLDSCQAVEQKQEEVVAQKDLEIAALKKKPKFFRRVWDQVRNGSILITIGIVAAKAFGI